MSICRGSQVVFWLALEASLGEEEHNLVEVPGFVGRTGAGGDGCRRLEGSSGRRSGALAQQIIAEGRAPTACSRWGFLWCFGL